ncbi:MAG: glycosyltransferase family 4 protein [Thermoplasmata archaeon]|nr:glycosyltransferase family 4 protein [Thermoplasmata archaeon]
MESRDLAFVSDRAEPFYPGGYEHHLWQLARNLARDHRVTLYTSLPQRRLRIDGVDLVRISPYWAYTRPSGGHGMGGAALLAATQAAYFPAGRAHDFIDLQGIPYAHVPGLRGRFAWGGDRWGITIWEAWFGYPPGVGWRARATRFAVRNLIRIATTGRHPVIVGSGRTGAALARRFGVPPQRIRKVTPSVDLAQLAAVPMAPRPAEIVTLGRLESYKRFDDALRALDLLRRRGRRPTMVVLGDGAERGRLEALSRDLRLTEQVRFLGAVDDPTKFAVMKSGPIFLLPSEREGFSIATLEAMACGRVPIVAQPPESELFGVGEVVEPGENGLSFPVTDVAALADRISDLMDDTPQLERYAAAARATAQEFTIERTTAQYLDAIEPEGELRGQAGGTFA